MRNIYTPVILSIFTFCSIGYFFGQKSANTSGGTALGSNGSVSYSIGQPISTSNASRNGLVSQGVRQTRTKKIIQEKQPLVSQILLYPNPVVDVCIIEIQQNDFKSADYKIFDLSGKVVLEGPIKDVQTKIDLNNLVSSTYILEVKDSNKVVEEFKIVKN